VLRNYQLKAINDIRQAWTNKYKSPCLVAPCGAGKSLITAELAKQTTLKNNRVLFLVHRQELVEQIETTFKNWGVDRRYCQVAMVQTLTRRLKKTKEPKLIITDENHHCLANSYKRIYEYFPNAYKIGVTATPVRLNGSGLGEVNDTLINTVSCKWLIENKFLAPFDYYAPPIADLSGLKTSRGEFVVGESEEKLNKPAICGDVINYYKQLADGKKAICYCVSVNHSKAMVEEFKNAGIKAAHIDGDTPKPDRRDIIDKFRNGEIKILCNVDLISEGFDVPDCEVAILLRPTQSLTLYIQQSMRCMRYMENKKAIIIDHVGNAFRFGLPDMDREWSLDQVKKTKKREKSDSEVKVRQCPECFYTHEPSDICPRCEYVYPKKERTIEEIKDAALEKVTEIVLDYSTSDDCKTMGELMAFAKKRGYKPGWGYIQGKRMGLI
jgi:superfamily II DNA or RNA helicase